MTEDQLSRTRKIKIAVDARPLSTPLSGVSRVISRIIKFFPDRDRYEFLLYSHRPWHPDFDEIIQQPNVIWVQGRGITAKKGGLWFNLTLPGILGRGDIDLFWGSQQVIPPFLPRKIPVVLTYYDLVLYLFPESMRPIARIQQRAFQRYSVNRADMILTISEQTRQDLLRKFGLHESNAKTALLGFEPPVVRKGERPPRKIGELLPISGPYILAVSTIEPRKNYRTLLEAYRRVRAGGRNLPLVIAGRRGWESEDFYRILEEIQDETGSVHIVEGATDEELGILFKNAAFFVMTSLYEGFGLPLLEALAAGKYAIASDLGCFHEIGGDYIRYEPPLDISLWKKALEDTIDVFEAGKLPTIHYPLKDWTWERTARLHQEAFVELLG